MRSTPVPIPDRISGFRSTVINGLIDFCESLRPIKSATVWPEWRPDGVANHAHNPEESYVEPFPFQVTRISWTEARVRSGTWTRCGRECALVCDTDQDYKTLTIGEDADIRIVLVDDTPVANAKAPTKVVAYTYPTPLYLQSQEKLIATIVGYYPHCVYQRHSGDINDTAVITPASVIADVASGAADSDGTARAAINTILAALRRHNLIEVA